MTTCDVCYTSVYCRFRDCLLGTISLLINRFFFVIGIRKLVFRRRLYGRLSLSIAGLLVFLCYSIVTLGLMGKFIIYSVLSCLFVWYCTLSLHDMSYNIKIAITIFLFPSLRLSPAATESRRFFSFHQKLSYCLLPFVKVSDSQIIFALLSI